MKRIPGPYLPNAEIPLGAWDGRRGAGELTASTEARYVQVFGFFCRFLEANGVTEFDQVDAAVCRAFIYAGRDGAQPASATARLRLTVIRDAFAALTGSGATVSNPTAALVVSHTKCDRALAPLTPTEAARLRNAGRVNPKDSLRPATVELALLGAAHELLGRVRVSDLDLTSGRVQIGCRWRDLDPWGASVLRMRIATCRRASDNARLRWDPTQTAIALTRPHSAYPATSIGPIVSTNLLRAMDAAGLSRPDLRPSSVREYAANRAYARTGRIEDVADLLGLASLDVAMRYIDRDWQDTHAKEVANLGQN